MNKRHAIKTTTKEGKRIYMKNYMPNYRKVERELINMAKQEWGWKRQGLQILHKKGESP